MEGVRKAIEIIEKDIKKWKKVNIPLVLCEKNIEVYVVSSKALPFGEVDTPEDLRIIKEKIYPKIKYEI